MTAEGAQPVSLRGLSPGELEEILRRIDDHLAFRPGLNAMEDEGLAVGAAPTVLEDGAELRLHLRDVEGRNAPFFVHTGLLGRWLARAANVPLLLFGRKQHRYNRDVLALFDLVSRRVDSLCAALARQDEARVETRRFVAALRRDVVETNNRMSGHADEGGGVPALWQELHGLKRWFEQMNGDLRGHQAWVELLQKKLELLALEQRTADHARVQPPPQPEVANAEAYRSKVVSMPDGLRINVGCGELPLEGYINVDARPGGGIDVVADVRALPFVPGSVRELASAHVVEHFREYELRSRVLPHWRTLLRPDGCVRIVCPDWEAMLARLASGAMTLADFKRITFGAQEYDGDDHFAMYTPATLSAVLVDSGFPRVVCAASGRMNGVCPEMELLGYLS